jgi:hypothetical protein
MTGIGLPLGDAIVAGNMIVAAYAAYDELPDRSVLDPTVKVPAPFDFVAWITMEDFVLTPVRNLRRFYGFVAHDANASHYLIALRGTEGPLEWWDNLHATFVPFRSTSFAGHVAAGFDTIYRTLDVTYADAKVGAGYSAAPNSSFAEKIHRVIRIHEAEHQSRRHPDTPATADDVDMTGVTTTIAGHSLGGALATLYVVQNASAAAGTPLNPRAIYTFASPRVGDETFAAVFDAIDVVKWRIYNAPDLVPMLPPSFFGFDHVDQAYRVDTRTLSDVKQWSIACWHDMNSYLAALGQPMPKDASCYQP